MYQHNDNDVNTIIYAYNYCEHVCSQIINCTALRVYNPWLVLRNTTITYANVCNKSYCYF